MSSVSFPSHNNPWNRTCPTPGPNAGGEPRSADASETTIDIHKILTHNIDGNKYSNDGWMCAGHSGLLVRHFYHLAT